MYILNVVITAVAVLGLGIPGRSLRPVKTFNDLEIDARRF